MATAVATSAALSDAVVPSGRCLPSSRPTLVDQRRLAGKFDEGPDGRVKAMQEDGAAHIRALE